MLGLTQEAYRNTILESLQVRRLIAVTELGHNKAGGDTVDTNAVFCNLNCQCLGQHFQATLGGAVRQKFPLYPGDAAMDRGNIDDSAGDVIFLHIADGRLGAVGRRT